MPLDVVRIQNPEPIAFVDVFYTICGQNGLTLEGATVLAEMLARRVSVRECVQAVKTPGVI